MLEKQVWCKLKGYRNMVPGCGHKMNVVNQRRKSNFPAIDKYFVFIVTINQVSKLPCLVILLLL